MTGVLIKDGKGQVVGKESFAGDETIVPEFIEKYQKKFPDYTFEVFVDNNPDWDSSFKSIPVVLPPVAQDSKWVSAKSSGPMEAIVFIAKFLGIE